MTSPVGTGSISLTGLLGGTAGQIDTTSLIASLMQAAAVPQNQLKDQLSTQQGLMMAYQAINTKMTALQTAAQALTDPTAWTATAATSSSTGVLASSTGTPVIGTTTFNVVRTASAQTSTVAADGSGNVVSNPAAGITITGADGTAHQIALTSGSTGDVASAINAANLGVRATVVNTDSGTVLQLSSTTTGSNAAFTASGFQSAVQTVVAAQSAQIAVGDPAAGGYTVSSQTNTFADAIPGVTFTVSAAASNVTISVASDEQSLATKMQALVDAANVSRSEIASDTGAGAPLQGTSSMNSLLNSVLSSVSQGTASGGILLKYGIDMDKNGVISFDATAFATAFAADPTGTQTAIAGSFAASLNTTATNAIDPTSGSVTQAMSSITTTENGLNTQITNWTSRLADIQTSLQQKYNAMETALASLQSKQTYLTSMLNSLNNSQNSNNNN
jgi:flagellar hook-associated protein 2